MWSAMNGGYIYACLPHIQATFKGWTDIMNNAIDSKEVRGIVKYIYVYIEIYISIFIYPSLYICICLHAKNS
jgi:hypothetical protein